jgi:hypothetical protein
MAPTKEELEIAEQRGRFAQPRQLSSAIRKRLDAKTTALIERIEIDLEMGGDRRATALVKWDKLVDRLEAAAAPPMPFLDDPAAVGELTTTYRHDGSVVQKNSLGQVRVIPPSEETKKTLAGADLSKTPPRDDMEGKPEEDRAGAVLDLLEQNKTDEAIAAFDQLDQKGRHEVTVRAGKKADALLASMIKNVEGRG